MTTDADPLLTGPECADRLNLTSSTWRSYVHRGYAPPPDDPDSDRPPNRRSPRWRASTVEAFRENRRKQGTRTDLADRRTA
jgi:hypothetical protein